MGGKPKAGLSNQSDSSGYAMCSIWDLKWSNLQGGPKQLLGTAWYCMQSY